MEVRGGNLYTSCLFARFLMEAQSLKSINETMALLSLGRMGIYALINNGTLETKRIGGRHLVKTSSINTLIESDEDVKLEKSE